MEISLTNSIPDQDFNSRARDGVSTLLDLLESREEIPNMDPFSLAVAQSMIDSVLSWKKIVTSPGIALLLDPETLEEQKAIVEKITIFAEQATLYLLFVCDEDKYMI